MIDQKMIDPLCPVVSDLDPEEQAASYDRWFRAEVQASLDDPRPNLSHEQVMAEIHALIKAKDNGFEAD
jgi:hypothetical protein